jgi:hypothetical protein
MQVSANLHSLWRFNLPVQPSFWPNVIWYVSYQSFSHSWHTDLDYGSYRLPDLEIGLMAGVTGRQGMLTSHRHLIPRMIYSKVRVCPILWFVYFRTGLMWSRTVRYVCHFIYIQIQIVLHVHRGNITIFAFRFIHISLQQKNYIFEYTKQLFLFFKVNTMI